MNHYQKLIGNLSTTSSRTGIALEPANYHERARGFIPLLAEMSAAICHENGLPLRHRCNWLLMDATGTAACCVASIALSIRINVSIYNHLHAYLVSHEYHTMFPNEMQRSAMPCTVCNIFNHYNYIPIHWQQQKNNKSVLPFMYANVCQSDY